MCSQPPRDIDDGWILDEIKSALPLVDPDTKSFAFTGGEPLPAFRSGVIPGLRFGIVEDDPGLG
jgi:hypothetical protein